MCAAVCVVISAWGDFQNKRVDFGDTTERVVGCVCSSPQSRASLSFCVFVPKAEDVQQIVKVTSSEIPFKLPYSDSMLVLIFTLTQTLQTLLTCDKCRLCLRLSNCLG